MTIAASLLVGLIVYLSPIATALDNRALDWRMRATTLPASGDVVFVAIDTHSLREIGTWPWSRAVHADILDQLIAAGARDIFFDIDFAFASDAEGDTQFAQALERAGGATLLATFAQASSVGDTTVLSYNLPYEPFRDLSWPVSVNVFSDLDGLIRNYPSGARIRGEFIPSAATFLAAGALSEGVEFQINYATSPSDIPSLSAVDVARGDFAAEAVRGRIVIIGAAAIELGDQFAVPLHQVITGALVHALAIETLIQNTVIAWVDARVVAIALALLIAVLSLASWRTPWQAVSISALFMFGIEVGALYLFQTSFVSVPTGFVHLTLLTQTLMTLATSLDLNRVLLQRQDVEIRNSQALLAHLFEQSTDGIVILDENAQTLMQSQSAERVFGQTATGDVALPSTILDHVRSLQGHAAHDTAGATLGSIIIGSSEGSKHIEYLASPSVFYDPGVDTDATPRRQITAISARDVTQQKRQEREIAYLSTHDERTGALRRLPFLEFLGMRLDINKPTVVFALSLHRLKSINLTMGRDVGDEVLLKAVERLQSLDFGLSAIARLDGNVFGFFLENMDLSCDLENMAEALRACVTEVYELPEAVAQISARIGYFEVTLGATLRPEIALSRAEDALDTATSNGMRGVFAYDPSVAKQRARVREIERAMPGAVERNELYVLYQSQHRLSDGALIGVEALVRWKSPVLGQVYPDEFIPIAESNGFIFELGRFVLQQATRDAGMLPETATMAVNVSSLQFSNVDLHETVLEALADSGLAPSRLCLELTESVLLTEDNGTIETMQDIAMAGVTWAMDDFGTGFSSMAYLSSLPLAKVKLDKCFTMALHNDPSARVILRSVKALCDGMEVGLLCEGVETETHRAILLEEGCSEGQGYFYGRPMALDDIVASHAAPQDVRQPNRRR